MKKMNKLILLLLFSGIAGSPFSSSAQGLLKRMKETAKSSAENAVLNKTAEKAGGETEKVLNTKIKKKKDNNPADSLPVNKDEKVRDYATFDFIPGEDIIYFRDFSADAAGELPAGWNSSGSGAVMRLFALPGEWLQLHQNSAFLADNTSGFSENFTIEFDLLCHGFGNEIMAYPAFSFGFLSAGEKASSDNRLLMNPDEQFLLTVDATVLNDGNGNTSFRLRSNKNRATYFQSAQKTFPAFEKMIGKPVHVSIQVQKERFRIWFGAEKLFDVPKAVAAGLPLNQLYFEVSDNGMSNEQVGVLISNIKIAKGIPDTRHKLLEEGRFSTTGILFEVNSSVIRPASHPVLKEIADLLKQHTALKLMITGHTDADGKEQDNLKLSLQRATAVKTFLMTTFGISEDRLQVDGKGEGEPVADNSSAAGKAANRRVEFTRISN